MNVHHSFILFLSGIIAIVFSVMSSSAADEGDLEAARVKGKISLALSLIGIFSTIIIVVIIIVYFVAIVGAAVDAINDSTYNDMYN